jgi:hypothetical protein
MSKRDNAWLQSLLDDIWDTSFQDVQQVNDVRIEYGRRAKRRLGSISLDPLDKTVSVITINGIFKREVVPEMIVRSTIVHELTHYSHGFNSMLERSQAHPHAGGVMKREYSDRGLLDLYIEQKKWLRLNWAAILQAEFPARPSRAANPNRVKMSKEAKSGLMTWLIRP